MAIDYEKRNGIAYITLNNPEKANILDKATSDDISAAWIDRITLALVSAVQEMEHEIKAPLCNVGRSAYYGDRAGLE